MAKGKESLVYLDTHVVVWLYDALTDRLSKAAAEAIEENDLTISRLVELELQFLHEIGRLRVKPAEIIRHLSTQIGLRLSDVELERIIRAATGLDWTRDVFDRLITAESATMNLALITKDRTIRAHHKLSIW
jgi:PIN domain nuclease of toxin-antitoxin system